MFGRRAAFSELFPALREEPSSLPGSLTASACVHSRRAIIEVSRDDGRHIATMPAG